MSAATYIGPPREGERYADTDEWEFHMNGPVGSKGIPGARWHEHTPEWYGPDDGVCMDLVVPVDTAPVVW